MEALLRFVEEDLASPRRSGNASLISILRAIGFSFLINSHPSSNCMWGS